ncbi:MAG TPA: hypothetical protein VFA21_04115 [Pyrinomonadaceae bacterium]|nr:hypothetical protein [Pyrinomonadaceae bacterium]
MESTKTQSHFLVEMPCAFGATPSTPRNGVVTRIGLKRCFVKTKVAVAEGQPLFLRVWTNDDRWLRLRGTVKYHMEMVGFSLVFGGLEEEDAGGLAALVDGLSRERK